MIYKTGLIYQPTDIRTLQLRSVLRTELPIIPEKFDIDPIGLKDNRMFSNDKWGCCTISAMAHQTLRFEQTELNRMLNIKDDEVLAQYWLSQGAIQRPPRKFFCYQYPGGWNNTPDNGLTMEDALKGWSKGWVADGNKYTIYAYGTVDPCNDMHVRTVLYLLNGAYVALAMPKGLGEVWDVVDYTGTPDYHCVYMPSTVDDYYYCWTWGKKQKMTKDFLAKYCYAFYGVVDNLDSKESILQVDKLKSYLDMVRK